MSDGKADGAVRTDLERITELIPEEIVPVANLKDHPRNYVEHPPDEIAHIKASIKENSIYKNIVIAEDDTILAGHGVTQACKELGIKEVPVRRLPFPYDHPRALKVLAGDNEIRHLAEIDDRALTNILKDVGFNDPTALMGTGYDEMMVANLDAVTRPPDEIRPHNETDHWVGLPDYEAAKVPFKVIIQCETDEDRQEFLEMIGAKDDPSYTMVQTRVAISMWWPLRTVKADRKNAAWEEEGGESDVQTDPPELSTEEIKALVAEQDAEQDAELGPDPNWKP